MKTQWRSSIAYTLMAWLIALSVVPVLIVSWLGYQNASVSIDTMQQSKLEDTAKINVKFLNDWFLERERDLRHWSESEASQSFLASLGSHWGQSGQSLEAYVQSEEYRKLLNIRDDVMVRISRNYDFVYDIFLIDLHGNILYTVAKESDLGTNLLNGIYSSTKFAQAYRATLQEHKSHFSDLEHYAPSGGVVAGFLTAPMRDESGKMVGVIALQLRMNTIFEQLEKSNAGNGEIRHYLVGSDGLLRTKLGAADEVLRRRISTEQFWYWYNEHGLFANDLKPVNERATVYFGPEGKKVLGQHQALDILGVRWAHISEIDEETSQKTLRELAKKEISGVVLTLLSVIAAALLIARRLTRPIYRLSEASIAYVNGSRDIHIPVDSDDELGHLSEVFNQMVEAQKENEFELRKHAQEAIRALDQLKEQKFALDAHAIVAITDVKGTIRFVNEKFVQISGYSADELIGQNHRIVNSGFHSHAFWQEMYHVVSHGGVWHNEVCNRAKDGRLYWVDTTIVPFMGPDHKPESYVAIRTDITSRKEAEKELHKALRLQKAIFENAGVGIIMTDVQGIVTSVNAAAIDMLGYSAKELEGNSTSLFYQTGDLVQLAEEVSAELGEKIEPGFEVFVAKSNRNLPNVHEWTFVRKDGTAFPVYLTITALQQVDGSVYGYLGIATDFSARKEAEKQIVAAKEAAEVSDKAKSEFLAAMSHEIRTPMNGVLGMLALLSHSSLNETQRHQLSLAQNSAQSLLGLINDILDFSKVEAGKMELEMIEFSLLDELGEFIEAIAIRANEKGLELILDTTGLNRTMVVADTGRIRQILTNLVSNAIKFTHEGEIVITVKLHEKDEHNARLHVDISDTGIGIPENKIGSLFDLFTQADSSTTRKYGGTGLGLAIVKKLCELMEGSVSVLSRVNQGSTFSIDVAVGLGASASLPVPRASVSGKSALIVDDHRNSRSVIRRQFEKWGIEVFETDNPQEALQLCRERIAKGHIPSYDAALIDLQMPHTDGMELGNQLRSIDECTAMKMVLMTSIGLANDIRSFASAGFDSFFAKPTIMKDMLKAADLFTTEGELQKQSTEEGPQTSAADENTIAKWPVGTRILLVEDNPTNQIVAQGILETIGLNADVAGNGIEAIEALKMGLESVPYTIILMDCQMPEMDGYEATTQIRSGKAGEMYKTVPIVAMTANAMTGDREKCMVSGMSDYLAKPVHLESFKAILRKWLLNEEEKETPAPIPSSSSKPVDDVEGTSLDVWDEQDALSRMGGNGRLLKTVIGSFVTESQNMMDGFLKALDANDFPGMQLHAHSIKGSAGNLSAFKLQEKAKMLESAAKEGNETVLKEGASQLKEALNEVLKVFEPYLKPSSANAIRKKKRFDPLGLAIALQTLRNRLKNNEPIDAERESVFGEYADETLNESMARLQEYLQGGNTADALDAIDRMMSTLE